MWFVVLSAFLSLGYAATPDGVIVLNEDNFDKVIRGDLYVLIKIDKKYSWGDAEDHWKSFTEQAARTPELLLVEIHLDEENESQNKELAKMFDAEMDVDYWPYFRLLKKGSKTNYAKFEGQITQDSLHKFVTTVSGLWIGQVGCLQEFDELAKDFAAADKGKQAEILESAKKILAEYDGEEMDKKRAKYYTKAMTKIMNDNEYLDKEPTRIDKVMTQGNMTPAQKEWADNRLNILASFGAEKPEREKEEL